jgi:hypothetical protein
MVISGPAQNRTVVLQTPTCGFYLQSTPFLALVPPVGQNEREKPTGGLHLQ